MMKNLVKIIGPAPSEATDEQLNLRLRTERTRVSDALAAYKFTPKAKKISARVKKVSLTNKVKQACEELGITTEEFFEMKAEMDAEKGEKDETKI